VDAPALPPDVIARVAALAEADPDREVCGLVVRGPGGDEVVAIRNALPPGEAARGFEMDPAALLAALRAAERRGAEVVAVWHSHPRGGPALSARDRQGLVLDGAPAFPGALLLVVALSGRRAASAAIHRWNGRDFDAFPLRLPGAAP
jgi:proteasome lid subunit RPN8/RPN11